MGPFGQFECVRERARGPFHVVWSARRAGDPKSYVVKICQPSTLLSPDAVRAQLAAFDAQTDLQERVAARAGAHWAPIRDRGRSEDEAYAVTDEYTASAAQLMDARVRVGEEGLAGIVDDVVAGLKELREVASRGHGKLSLGNVLLNEPKGKERFRAVLADPAPADPGTAERDDVARVGELIVALVSHRAHAGPSAWPLEKGQAWSALGRSGPWWHELCNRLLTPSTAERMTLDELAEALTERPAPSKRGRIWLGVAAVCALLVLAGAAAWLLRPPPVVDRADYELFIRAMADDDSISTMETMGLVEVIDEGDRSRTYDFVGLAAPPEGEPRGITVVEGQATGWFNRLLSIARKPNDDEYAALARDAHLRVILERLAALAAPEQPFQAGNLLGERGALYVRDVAKTFRDGLDDEGKPTLALEDLVANLEVAADAIKETQEELASWPAIITMRDGATTFEGFGWATAAAELRAFEALSDVERPGWAADAGRLIDYATSGTLDEVTTLRGAVLGIMNEIEPGVDHDAVLASADGTVSALRDTLAAHQTLLTRARDCKQEMVDKQGALDAKELSVDLRKKLGIPDGGAALEARVETLGRDVTRLFDPSTSDTEEARRLLDELCGMSGELDTFTIDLIGRIGDPAEKLAELRGRVGKTSGVSTPALQAVFDAHVNEVADEIQARLDERPPETPLEKGKLNLEIRALRERIDGEVTAYFVALDRQERDPLLAPDDTRPAAFDADAATAAQARRRGAAAAGIATAALDANDLDAEKADWSSFRAWCDEARAMLADLRTAEVAIDAGFALDESTPDGLEVRAVLKEYADQDAFLGLEEAVAPLAARVATLEQVAAAATLADVEPSLQSDDVAVVLAAWRRMGASSVATPGSRAVIDAHLAARARVKAALGAADPKRVSPERRTALDAEIDTASSERWIGHAERADADTVEHLAQAAVMENGFGVTLDDLRDRPALAWNVLVYRSAMVALSTDDASARKATIRETFVGPLNGALGRLGQRAPQSGRRLLDDLQPLVALDEGGSFIKPTDRGQPSSADARVPGWVFDEGNSTDEVVRYTWNGHRLAFRAVDPSVRTPTWVCVDEMSVGLFNDLIEAAGVSNAVVDALEPADRGVAVWRKAGGGLAAASDWLVVGADLPLPDGLRAWLSTGPSPTLGHPMQRLHPALARYVASLIDCRLPTVREWQQASASAGSSGANLRDGAWKTAHDAVARLRDAAGRLEKESNPWPQQGSFAEDRDPSAGSAAPNDDGDVFLREVDPAGDQFRNLIGNVAEYVSQGPTQDFGRDYGAIRAEMDGNKNADVKIIGASALSPPEVAAGDPTELPTSRRKMAGFAGYADVGFRLALALEGKIRPDFDREMMELLGPGARKSLYVLGPR